MISEDQNFAALREELARISERISRYALFSLAVLFFLFVVISRAYSLVRNDEIDRKVREVSELARSVGERPDFPDVIGVVYHGWWQQVADQVDPEGVRSQTDTAEVLQRISKLEEEIEQAERNAGEQLKVKYSLFGNELPIDLRDWFLILPLAFVLFVVYLWTLRKKYDALYTLAAHRLRSASPGAVTDVDHLLFGAGRRGKAPFARHPGQMGGAVYLLCVALFFGFLLRIGSPLWAFLVDLLQRDGGLLILVLVLPFVQMLLLVAFFSTAYSTMVSAEIREQLSSLTGRPSPPDGLSRTWRRVMRGAHRLVRRVSPKLSLPAGSALVLSTLLLTFAATASSCSAEEPEARTGYQLLAGRDGALWFTSVVGGVFETSTLLHLVGRCVYALSLSLAVATMVVTVLSVTRPGLLRNRGLVYGLLGVSLAVSLFVLADYAFTMGVFGNDLLPVKLAVWLVPLGFWFRHARNGPPPRRVWSTLLAVYAPLVAYACLFVLLYRSIGGRPTYGLAAYLLGTLLITLGYLHLAGRRGPQTEAGRVPASHRSSRVLPRSEEPVA